MVEFIKNLFSWTFKGMITLSLLKVVYGIVLILAVIFAIPTFGGSILALLFIRIGFECIIIFWKMNENLQAIREYYGKEQKPELAQDKSE